MDVREGYKEKFIKDLKENEAVAVSGVVVNRDDNSLFIDDGSGQMLIGINNAVEQGKYVRVFGRVIGFEEGLQIQGEVLQDLSRIDKQLHKKLKEILNKE